ncbi:MAG: tRNA (N(6)-L-threonylcarbamoyladenosine(37)-C(2))-methylthiotransferase MtaB [Rhodospirillales bacterium]|jgi:threonylcarbamoyladenosine tRNA methylthiotransferase MtaB|nr:tRNA (N(6)-L-threonylcarbamoyladenosine(37)-C(2))-methylthiotransferase MtaB [Rhodospirillales bacterium]
MSGLEIITLGCRLNSFESEVMREQATAAGLKDTVIINSCAVTAEAERQTRQSIRRAAKDRPGAQIIVAGCAVQITPAKFAAMPEVDRVLGNTEKLLPEHYAPEHFAPGGAGRVAVSDIMTETSMPGQMVTGFETRSRAFVQIQQGCDHRCSFCIIPFGRGNSRSVRPGRIIEQARRLVAEGYLEAVLTGVDISSYGGDLADGNGLGRLARTLLGAVPGLARLRLSSLDPARVDRDLIDLAGSEPRLMPHFHLSVQAGSDLILKRMKRRHLRADVIELCRDLRGVRPGAVFGADLIAGFPTESEAMFAETLSLIEEAGLAYLHVFPYSPRPGTPAAAMPQIDPLVRRERAQRLRQAGNAVKLRYLKRLVGSRATVLTEKDGKGYTEHYAPVRLAGAPQPGSLLPVEILGVRDMVLTAEPVR